MSGRRRRSETSWYDKEEKGHSAEIHSSVSPGRSQKWSKSEVHEDLMHNNFSRSPSWDTLQGNRNRSNDDDIRKDRNRMYSHPTFDGWEKQYSTHPSDDSYDLPYRSRDKGVGGNVRMSRERERSRSPNGSRSRSRDGMGRSSRESSRGRRDESNTSYPNMRSNSKDFTSRGGGNNITENWSRRTDYKDGSRYNDYSHRNVYDDYRNTRISCKFFAAGHCNRDNCKFSHDVAEGAGGYDHSRNLGNKNRTWRDDQQPHDDLNAKSNLGEMEKKSWNSSSWDDVKSGGFDETSRKGHTSDDNNNNNTWDSMEDKKKLLDGHASQDASGFNDFGKSHRILDNKKRSWNGPTSWDGVSGSGFSSVSNPCHKYEQSAKESLNDNNAKGGMSAQSGSNTNRNNTKKWDGPLWEDFSEPVMIQTDNSKIRKWGDPGLNKLASANVEIVVNNSDLNNAVPEDANQQILTSFHDMNSQSNSYLNGPEQSHTLLSNPFNGLLNGEVQGMYVHMENQNKGGGKPPKPLEVDVPQSQAAKHVNETSLTSQLSSQANALPADTSHKGQLSQVYTDLHLSNAIDFLKSLPNSAYNQDTRAKEEQISVRNMEVQISVPMEILSGSVTQQNQMPADLTHDSSKLGGIGVSQKEAEEGTDKRVATNGKKEEENTHPDNSEPRGKSEEGDIVNDEKAMRQFKIGLVEFVKEILKPKWKEGKMSREVHKTVVKKVVEKVTSTIQGSQIPRTQPKTEQYLSYSKPKITKLVEAYMERLLKA